MGNKSRGVGVEGVGVGKGGEGGEGDSTRYLWMKEVWGGGSKGRCLR